ncbi:MAG: stage II sporulation protein M, partial [Desulfuromonadales bacterium]|nr:stage II sporulation protein M [Desulfuromonadales bacterium]NIS43231.1 stage II sporulation protein M [Desulfuromonadales bacterium]
ALFLMVFLGMVFSIFPLLALFANGFIVGAALLYAPLSWWQLLPHGIFEIPAIFIAAAYG